MSLQDKISDFMAAVDAHQRNRAQHVEEAATLEAEAGQLIERGRAIGFKKREVAKMLELPKAPVSELTPAAPVAAEG